MRSVVREAERSHTTPVRSGHPPKANSFHFWRFVWGLGGFTVCTNEFTNHTENVQNGKLVLKGSQTRINNLNFALWFSVSVMNLDELSPTRSRSELDKGVAWKSRTVTSKGQRQFTVHNDSQISSFFMEYRLQIFSKLPTALCYEAEMLSAQVILSKC
jgi:hypothetical protein